MRGRASDVDRAVSESLSVAVLLAFTVLLTASLGAAVLFLDVGETETDAEFSFQHLRDASSLLISFDDGQQLPGGDVIVAGPAGNVTWAELAGSNETDPLRPGDTVQVSQASAYGASVTSQDEFHVVYVTEEGERVVLATRDP